MIFRIQDLEYELRWEANLDGTWTRYEFKKGEQTKYNIQTRSEMLSELEEKATEFSLVAQRRHEQERQQRLKEKQDGKDPEAS